jgi:OOP family OmpA-OmpF porin
MGTGQKRLIAALIGAAFAFCAPAAVAQGMQDRGWYLGGHLGQADVDGLDEDDTSWKIVGGYKFSRNFAAEVGYIDFGKTRISLGSEFLELKANAMELVGVGSLPVADRFSVYGKLGVFRGEAKARFNLPSLGLGSGTEKDSNTDLTFGFGASYDATRNIAVRGEWQRYQDVGDATDIDVLSLGVLFRFQ